MHKGRPFHRSTTSCSSDELGKCRKAAIHLALALELVDAIDGLPGIAAANIDLALCQLQDAMGEPSSDNPWKTRQFPTFDVEQATVENLERKAESSAKELSHDLFRRTTQSTRNNSK